MLLAHLVPGYFAASIYQSRDEPNWRGHAGAGLWVMALGACVAPDIDVVRNLLFRGFFGHSVLITHSIFPYVGLLLAWVLVRRRLNWPFLATTILLTAIGGLSHLALDVVSHGTPLFYPWSTELVGRPSDHVLLHGLFGYLTDPIFLLEPLLICLAIAHWTVHCSGLACRWKKVTLCCLLCGLALFSATFLMWRPELSRIAAAAASG